MWFLFALPEFVFRRFASVMTKKSWLLLRNSGGSNVSFNRFVGMSSPSFSIIFSIGFNSNQVRKATAVFIFLGLCALNVLQQKSHAFYKDGGILCLEKRVN